METKREKLIETGVCHDIFETSNFKIILNSSLGIFPKILTGISINYNTINYELLKIRYWKSDTVISHISSFFSSKYESTFSSEWYRKKTQKLYKLTALAIPIRSTAIFNNYYYKFIRIDLHSIAVVLQNISEPFLFF